LLPYVASSGVQIPPGQADDACTTASLPFPSPMPNAEAAKNAPVSAVACAVILDQLSLALVAIIVSSFAYDIR
jgi:hypothetical protein